jgi:hypothetical protein
MRSVPARVILVGFSWEGLANVGQAKPILGWGTVYEQIEQKNNFYALIKLIFNLTSHVAPIGKFIDLVIPNSMDPLICKYKSPPYTYTFGNDCKNIFERTTRK